ncbi:outer membrane beta-barrel protein [Flavobacterium sp.]|uniref:outer membrane beta-barrel protein n=1 Tax=Flavobacterium sp. TaxID=239 RepID=UPI002B4B127D|nr:outer membrane beta-barrel protein [Flavobacterium sp.]
MKKIILSAIMLIGLAFSAQAQEISKNAIGLRIGDNDGFGAEVSYQRKLSTNNRLELDLGWRNRDRNFNNNYNSDESSVKLAGLYQWVWNIDGGFNWYVGVGGGLANNSYDYYDNDNNRYDESYTYAFAAGDIGIEYDFDIPLMLSLDFRPEFYFTDKVNEDFGPDVAFSVRYQF